MKHSVFLVDALGGLVSTLFLSLVLPALPAYIGMPVGTLHFLGGIAAVLLISSSGAYLFTREGWRPYLKVTIMANTLYALTSVGLLLYHYASLKPWGIIYFLLEVVVLAVLIRWERSVLKEGPPRTSV